MRILVVTTSYPLHPEDASGAFVAGGAAALASRGHDVTVLAPLGAGSRAEEEMDGVHVRRFPYAFPTERGVLAYGGGIPANLLRRPRAWLQLPAFRTALRSAVREALPQADVLHAHWSLTAWLVADLTRSLGVPLLVSLHGSDLTRPRGLRAAIARRLARQAMRLVVSSERMAARLHEAGVGRALVTVVPYGLAPEPREPPDRQAAREALGLPAEATLVLHIGRMVPVKNQPMLLRAFARIADEFPRAQLILAGDGPERPRLERLAKASGLRERVAFPGAVSTAEVRTWLAAADVFALASRNEGYGQVVREAMSAGRALVATAVGGVPEVVEHGRTGLLVRGGREADFAGALRALLTDAEMRRRMGRAARERIREKGLDWDAHAARLEMIYTDASGCRGASGEEER